MTKKKSPSIEKHRILQYLMYANEEVDLKKFLEYLAMYSQGFLKITYTPKNKSEWNLKAEWNLEE